MTALDAILVSSYWQTTVDCLVAFHGLSRPEAVQIIERYRGRLAVSTADIDPDGSMEGLIYHQEPFHLACDLAGRALDIDSFRESYRLIAARNEDTARRRTPNLVSRGQIRDRMPNYQELGDIIGRSPEMEKLYRIISKVAQSNHPLLISGESGTGKKLVARTIHANGPHAANPFIRFDCGSVVPTLIESELFGYVKGAFTGAVRSKDGLFASSGNGTLFLDKIGELPLDIQTKLLRALQEKEVRPVGATHRIPIRARVLAATNRDLRELVGQGRFLKELCYRLDVVNLRIPPLRERRSDIPLLAAHFLDRLGGENGVHYTLSDEALGVMMEYPWPGNVRELENEIRLGASAAVGSVLQIADFSIRLAAFRSGLSTAADARLSPAEVATAVPSLEQIEQLAHNYWVGREGRHGSHALDWQRAERELRETSS